MSAQLLILRVFRWVAVCTAIIAINSAGLTTYLEYDYLSNKTYSTAETVDELAKAVQFKILILLVVILVWIAAVATEKYLRSSVKAPKISGAPIGDNK